MITRERPELERFPSSTGRVAFRDCDVFGHLHNSRYLDVFLEARERHLLEAYDFDVFEHTRETGQGWFVIRNEIVYVRPARFHERIHITTQLFDLSHTRLCVEFAMHDARGSELKALMWSVYRAVDILTSKPISHSRAFLERFEPIVAPLPAGTITLDQRAEALRAAARAS